MPPPCRQAAAAAAVAPCLGALLLLACAPPAAAFNPNRPRNPHKAGDVECRPQAIFPRLNPGSPAHLAEYDLESLLPGAIDGCHTLWLSDFELWDEGAITVANALKDNTDVHTIYMHFSHVGCDGAEAFAELLKHNQALHTINFGHNSIENEGAFALAEALKVNTGLHTLTLDHNKIHEPGIQALIDALKVNEDLLHMNVHSNHFNLQSPPHAQVLENQIEALLHGHAFHHFHHSREVEDTTNLEDHAPHPMRHIDAHRDRMASAGRGADGNVGSAGIDLHHGEPPHHMKDTKPEPHPHYGDDPPPVAKRDEL